MSHPEALPVPDIDPPPPSYEVVPDAQKTLDLPYMAEQLQKLTSLIAEREAKSFDTTVTEALRKMERSLIVAATASSPSTLQRAQDEIESAKRACSNRIEDLDAIRQLQEERESTKARLEIISSLAAVEQEKGDVFEEDMVLVGKTTLEREQF